MPVVPRIAISNPTDREGIPRPPVKLNGRVCLVWDGEKG